MNRRFRRWEDPEDVVQPAFRTFYRRNAPGEFRIDSSANLWRLLETITRRQMRKHLETHCTEKRSLQREDYPEADSFPGQNPTADEALIWVELMEKALDGLDESYAQMFPPRLQSCSKEEIAAKLGCSRATLPLRERTGERPPACRVAGPRSS